MALEFVKEASFVAYSEWPRTCLASNQARSGPSTRLPAEIFHCGRASCHLRATFLQPMRVDLFAYELPADRIAQHPLADREAAKLLVVAANPSRYQALPGDSALDDTDGAATHVHKTVADLAALIPSGAVVVINDTRVIPARLLGHKISTGGKAEIFLVRCLGTRTLVDPGGASRECAIWSALGKASKPFRVDGGDIAVGPIRIRLLARNDAMLEVALWTTTDESIDDAIAAHGHVPLPPYIHRSDEPADRDRYQTVFARAKGAVAAPTAGLHLTHDLLFALEKRGCIVAPITLHVGLGTFQPVTVTDLDDHPMHSERYEIPEKTADAINRARSVGAPIVAIGTTVVRALESAALVHAPAIGALGEAEKTGHVYGHGHGHVYGAESADELCLISAGSGETRLLIQPGFRFRVVDALFTNFHLSESTLLALVSAFAGRDVIFDAYAEAIRSSYRFFSYGDAMFVWRAG